MKSIKKYIGRILHTGGIGVIPTDTLYAISTSAFNQDSVEKVYRLRKRGLEKPMIVLISSLRDVAKFEIVLTREQKKIMKQYWPGKVSIIVPCKSEEYNYLHRGKQTLAFRVPDSRIVRSFLKYSGPIVAPSANLEGLPPAHTISKAKEYFGEDIEFYVDIGKLESDPSTIISINEDGHVSLVRKGVVSI